MTIAVAVLITALVAGWLGVRIGRSVERIPRERPLDHPAYGGAHVIRPRELASGETVTRVEPPYDHEADR
jgi:hypothetical protein